MGLVELDHAFKQGFDLGQVRDGLPVVAMLLDPACPGSRQSVQDGHVVSVR